MSGSAGQKFLVASLLLITSLMGSSGVHAQSTGEIVLKGPVENINAQQLTLTILGQTLKVSRAVIIDVTPGNVLGLIKPLDQTAPYFLKSPIQYVPGSTQVFVSGIIAEVNRPLARFRIGSLWIDYTRVLSTSNFSPSVGAAVAVLGIQPTAKGTLLADGATLYNASELPPITGTISLIVGATSNQVLNLRAFYATAVFDGTYHPQSERPGGIVGGGIIRPAPTQRPNDPPPTPTINQ